MYRVNFNKQGFTPSCITNMQCQKGKGGFFSTSFNQTIIKFEVQLGQEALVLIQNIFLATAKTKCSPHCRPGLHDQQHQTTLDMHWAEASLQLFPLVKGITNLQPGDFHPSYKRLKPHHLLLSMLSREQLQFFSSCVDVLLHTRWLDEIVKCSQTGHILATSLWRLDTTGSLVVASFALNNE